MDQWLDWATVALTWGVRGIIVIVGLLFLVFLFRVITYREPEIDHSGRGDIYAEALAALRSSKKYHLKSVAIFDNNPQKLHLFAEALGGELRTQVTVDETGGEIVFFTAAAEEE